MKAIRVHELGGPEVLQYQEVPEPQAKAGEAVVEVEAAGLNFIDIYYRKGLYKTDLPFIPGLEAAGVVRTVGPGVDGLKSGDRVAYAMSMGAYAKYAAVPAWKLVPLPSGIDFRSGAAAMIQGMTAHYLTHSTYSLKSGETALVHAGAGGVGLLLTQIAKLRGARVFSTVSNEAKAKLAREAGADEVIIYTEKSFEQEVKKLTEGKGVEVVYDSVGKSTFEGSLNCLRPRGYLVLFGQASGPVLSFDPQILNAKGSLFLTRPSLGHYAATREELLSRAGDVLKWISEGGLKVRIDRTYPLSDASKAHIALESRQTTGKVLLIP